MTRRTLGLASILLAVGAGGCGGDDDDTAEPGAPLATETTGARPEVDVAPFTLEPLDDSDTTGSVRVNSAGRAGTTIVITLDRPGGEPLDAHVHRSRCARLGEDAAIAYHLKPVGEKPRDSRLDVTLRALLKTPHAVALHGPDGEHVACADIAGAADEE